MISSAMTIVRKLPPYKFKKKKMARRKSKIEAVHCLRQNAREVPFEQVAFKRGSEQREGTSHVASWKSLCKGPKPEASFGMLQPPGSQYG